MPVETLELPNTEIDPRLAEVTPLLGGIATEAQMTPQHTIEIGDKTYQTDIPEGIDVYDKDASFLKVRPSEIDNLPVGEFTTSRTHEYKDQQGQSHTQQIDDKLIISETPYGKAINEGWLDGGTGWIMDQNAAELMKTLGFIVTDKNGLAQEIEAVPTPLSLKAAAAEQGVDITFFPEDKIISGAEYLGAFADKKYPVSFGYYQHDIEDDHLTAMVLGGEPLKVALSEFATEALNKTEDEKAVKQGAQLVDAFTASLRTAVIAGRNIDGVYRIGESMGMDRKKLDEIVVSAQQKAEQFGIKKN